MIDPRNIHRHSPRVRRNRTIARWVIEGFAIAAVAYTVGVLTTFAEGIGH